MTAEAAETSAFVLTEIDGGVATVTMNRPDRLNALGYELRCQLHSALTALDRDDAVRCVVLTGAGRAFSSGADISGGAGPGGSILNWYRFGQNPYGHEADVDVRAMDKPVIAAVNGLCYGAGLIHAAECDLVVAAESARFCMIEARMGNGGSHILPYRIGPQWTNFLMFTGEVISARRAKEIGLVLEVVPDDELLAQAQDLARRVAAMPRHAVMFSKKQTNGTLDMMGFLANQTFSLPNQAILNYLAKDAEAPDGRRLHDILAQEGFAAFKAARDAVHADPWLKD
jgi:enoyl-CoA hydratase/carnithine racemase